MEPGPEQIGWFAKQINEQGALAVIAAAFILLAVWQVWRQNKREDRLLERLMFGNGGKPSGHNGEDPSMAKIIQRLDDGSARMDEIDQRQAETTQQVEALAEGVESLPCKVLAEGFVLPGCPASEQGGSE